MSWGQSVQTQEPVKDVPHSGHNSDPQVCKTGVIVQRGHHTDIQTGCGSKVNIG